MAQDISKVYQEKGQLHKKGVWKERGLETVRLIIKTKAITQHRIRTSKVDFMEATGKGGECKAELTDYSGGLRSGFSGSTALSLRVS